MTTTRKSLLKGLYDAGKIELEGIDLGTLEENSDEWDHALQVVGFED